ncbi:hypothetical protein BGZ82_007679 [Podila clonocystis]|nr:hypothetical protein BGZ82_007679 [Podila clonocystis]
MSAPVDIIASFASVTTPSPEAPIPTTSTNPTVSTIPISSSSKDPDAATAATGRSRNDYNWLALDVGTENFKARNLQRAVGVDISQMAQDSSGVQPRPYQEYA